MADSLVHLISVFISFSCCFRPSFGDETGDTSTYQRTAATNLITVIGVIICLVTLIKWYCSSGGVCKSKARLNVRTFPPLISGMTAEYTLLLLMLTVGTVLWLAVFYKQSDVHVLVVKGKTAIVTGANTGIGKETALDFAKRGARVILACRDEQRASKAAKDIIAETGSDKVVVRIVDLASFESVRAFADLINETEERLDILVNNAGLGAAPYWVTKDGYESIFQVNYLSHFLLTLLLLGKIKKSAPSRIVNVSSSSHAWTKGTLWLQDLKLTKEKFDFFTCYSESKLAQVMFTRELSHRLEGSGVTTYVLHPGVIKTEIWRYWKVTHNLFTKPFVQFIMFLFFKDCKQGAQTTIYCSVAEELVGVSGLYYSDCKVKECNKVANDPGLRKKLWEVSERITGESWKN